MRVNKPKTIIIHHTGVQSRNPQLMAVNSYHYDKEFPISTLGFHVGYHFFIERDGKVTRTRNDSDEGAHTLGGWNIKSIGICLAGNFDVEHPTEAQLTSLIDLHDRYGYRVLLHREADTNRTCPGINFTTDWNKSKGRGTIDNEKCQGLQKKIKEQQTLIQQLLDFIINYLTK